jgi:hypothetical protein
MLKFEISKRCGFSTANAPSSVLWQDRDDDFSVDVVAVIEAPRPATLSNGWPGDFFDTCFGALKGEGLERPHQDNLEDRDALTCCYP